MFQNQWFNTAMKGRCLQVFACLWTVWFAVPADNIPLGPERSVGTSRSKLFAPACASGFLKIFRPTQAAAAGDVEMKAWMGKNNKGQAHFHVIVGARIFCRWFFHSNHSIAACSCLSKYSCCILKPKELNTPQLLFKAVEHARLSY